MKKWIKRKLYLWLYPEEEERWVRRYTEKCTECDNLKARIKLMQTTEPKFFRI